MLRADVRTAVALDAALPGAIAEVLDAGVEAVVVVVGPGSYTGLRSGMAAALGLSHALDVPLHGVGSLEVIAAGDSPRGERRGWAIADAGRGALFVAPLTVAVGAWRVGAPQRAELSRFDAGGIPVLSCDPLRLMGLRVVDPGAGLARAASSALQTPELPLAGLRAVYVE